MIWVVHIKKLVIQQKTMLLNVQRVIRLQYMCARSLRKIKLNNRCLKDGNSVYNLINTFNLLPQVCCYHSGVPCINLYSSSAASNSEELVDGNVFEKACEETLESLTECFEELAENKEVLKNADVSYSDGVLTVNLGSKLGTYVINRQAPNRQIWLSSPISGPKRYDFVVSGNYWIYKHDMMPLHKLLQSEISAILGEKIDFSKCLYSKV